MSRRRSFFVGLFVASLLLSTGCEEFLTLDELGGVPGASGPTSLNDPALADDPVNQASKVVKGAVDEIRLADSLLATGLADHSIQSIDQAARTRPRDPRYRFYKAAMQMALGQDKTAMNEAADVLRGAYPKASDSDLHVPYKDGLLSAILDTRGSFAPGSDGYDRLTRHYCSYVELYAESGLPTSGAEDTCS
jgi:hypothetical protein